jgi:hypothetical protein
MLAAQIVAAHHASMRCEGRALIRELLALAKERETNPKRGKSWNAEQEELPR